MLTVAIGNTNTAVGIWHQDILSHVVRLPSDRALSQSDWMAKLSDALSSLPDDYTPEAITCCSVVPALSTLILGALEHRFPAAPIELLSSGSIPEFTVAYENPSALGSDRYFCAYAAWKLYLIDRPEFTHVVVVDCGTATTFGVVAQTGVFLGGSILPGIGTSMNALLSRTAQLPPFDIVEAPLIATNTLDALRAGILYGFSTQINGMLTAYKEALHSPARILTVATGGAYPIVASHVIADRVDPELLLRGLFLAGRRRG